MATSSTLNSSESYWKTIRLVYPDGLTLDATLDPQTIERLRNPETREEAMLIIRGNVEESGVNTAAVNNNRVETVASENSVAENAPLEPIPGITHVHRNGDDAPSASGVSLTWPRHAALLLISLYKEHEDEMEDPRKKKRDVWKMIAEDMNKNGYTYSLAKIENKWKNLVVAHKDILDNKKKTGAKRKTFQYFEEMEEILNKRHDINPPFVSGSIPQPKTMKFSTKCAPAVISMNNEDRGVTGHNEETTSQNETEHTSRITVDTAPAHQNTPLSQSKSAIRRRANRKEETSNSNNNDLFEETLDVLRKAEAAQVEREKARNAIAIERNELLKQLLEVMKK